MSYRMLYRISKGKHRILILALIAVFPLVLLGSGVFFLTHSTGFTLDKIISNLSYNADWEIGSLTEEQKEILVQEVFPQKYHYLAAGNQCYAFISEDHQYVLKFFKMQNLFPKGWLTGFPLSFLRKLRFNNAMNNHLFSERIFASYKDAYELLREETGILYIHFNKSREFKSKVTLIDNKGKKHLIDLDKVEFVVQKRAQKIFDHLNQRIGFPFELRNSIRSFLKLIATRCEKGFVDQHLNIRNNFGFVNQEAIQFDCATLTRDTSMKYPLNFRREVMYAAERLHIWTEENCPEMSLFVQEEAQRIINHAF